MRQVILTAAIALAALAATATEPADTALLVKTQAQKIIVTSTADELVVETDHGIVYRETTNTIKFPSGNTGTRTGKSVTRDICLGDIYVGAVMPIGSNGLLTTAWEFGSQSLVGAAWGPRSDKFMLSAALGIGFRQARTADNMTIAADRDAIVVTPLPVGFTSNSATINSLLFSVPLGLELKPAPKVKVRLSGVMQFNTWTEAKVKYTVPDGGCSKTTLKGLHQRPLTVDICASVTIHGIGIYGRYNPVSQWAPQYGPDYRVAAAGLMLNF